MEYLISFISSFDRDSSQMDLIEMISSLVDCVTKIVLPLVEQEMKNKEDRSVNYFLQRIFLKLLSVASSFISCDLMFDSLFVGEREGGRDGRNVSLIDYVFHEKFLVEENLLHHNHHSSHVVTGNLTGLQYSVFRYSSLSILQNLLHYHNGIEILQSYAGKNYDSRALSSQQQHSHDEGSLLITQNRLLQISLSPFFSILKVVKLIRREDSFGDSMIVVGSLQLLLSYLKKEILGERKERYANSLYLHYLKEDSIWQWMMRYLYDRRNEVRSLSIDILLVLLPLLTSSSSSSSLMTKQAKKETEEREASDASGKDLLFHAFPFPPVEQLYFLFNDENEVLSNRMKCLLIIVRFLRSLSGDADTGDGDTASAVVSSILSNISFHRIIDHFKKILEKCFESSQSQSTSYSSFRDEENEDENCQQKIPGSSFSMEALQLMVDCLFELISVCSRLPASSGVLSAVDFVKLLNHHKLFPLLIQFMNSSFYDYFFLERSCSKFLNSSSSSAVGYSTISSSFAFSSFSLHFAYLKEVHDSKKLFNYKMMEVLLLIHLQETKGSSASTVAAVSSTFYYDCMKHSSLLTYLVTSLPALFTSSSTLGEENDDDEDYFLNSLVSHDLVGIQSLSAFLTMMMTLVRFDEKEGTSSLSFLENTFFSSNPSRNSMILFSAINRALSIMNSSFDYFYYRSSSTSSSSKDSGRLQREKEIMNDCLEKILQFLLLFIDLSLSTSSSSSLSQLYHYDLGFRVVNNSSMNELIVNLFIEIILFRIQLLSLLERNHEEEQEKQNRLSSQIELTMTFFLEKFAICSKVLKMIMFSEKYQIIQISSFRKQQEEDSQEGGEGGRKMENRLWKYYYSTILSAAQFIQRESASEVNAASGSATKTGKAGSAHRATTPAKSTMSVCSSTSFQTPPTKNRATTPTSAFSSSLRKRLQKGTGGKTEKVEDVEAERMNMTGNSVDSKALTKPFLSPSSLLDENYNPATVNSSTSTFRSGTFSAGNKANISNSKM
jgi:hypothetical protein